MSNIAIRQGFAPTTMTEAIQFSEMLASSNMIPKQYQGKPNDVLVCVQWGYEMGLAPMQALQNIAVINGKPSVYGDAAMALVQNNPVCEDIEEFIEDEGTPNPVAVCVAKRKGRKPVTAKFSVEDAKRAGLWGKQGPWTQYPKRMLQMRARGFALRDAFPDVLKGLITIEEAMDFPAEAKPMPVPVQEISHKADTAIEDMASDQIGEFPIFLPDGSIYSSHDDAAGWIESYCGMVKKIMDSTKLSDEAKGEKLIKLSESNMEVTDKFDSFHKLKLKGEMVKAGASVSPKSEVSPSNQDSEPNEL
jgi:hypothetical protein